MSTVSQPVSRFNPATPGFYTTDGDRIASYNPRSSHADVDLDDAEAEYAARMGAELDADRVAVLAEIEADRAIQAADNAHRNELAAAYIRAKELAGAVPVKIGRQVVIDDYGTATTTDAHWFAVLDQQHFGIGTSANAAVDNAVARRAAAVAAA